MLKYELLEFQDYECGRACKVVGRGYLEFRVSTYFVSQVNCIKVKVPFNESVPPPIGLQPFSRYPMNFGIRSQSAFKINRHELVKKKTVTLVEQDTYP
jgi:hypothetical protein